MTTQLYAKIKKSSKYHHQNEWAKEQGQFPFPVEIAIDYRNGGGYRSPREVFEAHLKRGHFAIESTRTGRD